MNKIKMRVIFVGIIILASSFLMGQSNYFVKIDAVGNNDGSNWTNAYVSLQSALAVASSGDEIYVAAGTYTPSVKVVGTEERHKAFKLIDNVEVYGGLAGNEDVSTYDMDNRDFTSNETILSGDLGSGNYAYHIFRHENLTLSNSAILDGFTLSSGKADGSGNDGSGAAMYNGRYSSPTVKNSTFKNNSATNQGGAVFNYRNAPYFENCTFTSNTVTGAEGANGGGAISISTSNTSEGLSLQNCTFTNNSVNTNPETKGAKGGAVRSDINPGFLTIEDCNFTENEALYGGALYQSSGNDANRDNSNIQITKCQFEENSATYGGAVFSDKHNSIISSCIIRGNEAYSQAGGFYSRYASSELRNCLVSGNKSVQHGGGVYFNEEILSVITNSTISGNYSGIRGGGISVIGTSSLNFNNSILWGNTSSEGNDFNIENACTTSFDYSLYSVGINDVNIDAGGVVNYTNCITTDPSFTNPITPTFANTPNLLGEYDVTSTSPAIDAGSNAFVPVTLTTDLSGNDRFIDGNGNSISIVDMGAYEFDPSEVPLPISLVDFSAEKSQHGVKLTWETASETNNATFLVYRNDKLIARIEGAGTTTETNNYVYVDETIVPGVSYTYVLADVDYANNETRYDDEALTVTLGNSVAAADFIVGAAYPNPFNPTAVVPVELSRDAVVNANVYTLTGREIATLVNESMSAGTHELQINATNMTTGLYLVRIAVEDVVDVQKIAFVK